MKGVIFDMDGTMFDSEKIWRDMWQHLPEEYGLEQDPTLGPDVCGTTGIEMRSIIKRHFPDLDEYELTMRGRKRYHDRITKAQPEEKPGLHELISHLKNLGYHLAIASGSDQDVIRLNLKRANLSSFFEATISGNDVVHGKPAPDIFLESARQIGCNPEECYVIEDGENGIRAAFAAGCTPIMVPDTTPPTEEMRKMCSGIYETLFDIIPVIHE
ncbi:MAG: HAD family phosphatase [Eubacteriales bacterium]|nr:HAD family phosphatase [Eubacteriales bacterium]